MLTIPARFDGRDIQLQILENRLCVADASTARTYDFTAIKSLHVKNADTFLLKLRLDDTALVFEFPSLNTRDLAKAILLNSIVPAENIQKAVLESNLEAKRLQNSIKAIVANSGKEDRLNAGKILASHLPEDSSLYTQRGCADIYSSNFIAALTQPLVDTFLAMNCSVNQFYNLIRSTYFYDIKNPKNSVDRLIGKNIRKWKAAGADEEPGGEPPLGKEMDFALRINSYSLMALEEAGSGPGERRDAKRRPVEFEPVYPFERHAAAPAAASGYRLKVAPLHCGFPVSVRREQPVFSFNSKDFELARDLCRMVHAKDPALAAEALSFAAGFKEMIKGRYGDEAMEYVEWLVPTFYMK